MSIYYYFFRINTFTKLESTLTPPTGNTSNDVNETDANETNAEETDREEGAMESSSGEEEQAHHPSDLSLDVVQMTHVLLKQLSTSAPQGPNNSWVHLHSEYIDTVLKSYIPNNPVQILDSIESQMLFSDLFERFESKTTTVNGSAMIDFSKKYAQLMANTSEVNAIAFVCNSVELENLENNLGSHHFVVLITRSRQLITLDSYNNNRNNHKDLQRLFTFLQELEHRYYKQSKIDWKFITGQSTFSNRMQAVNDDFSCGYWAIAIIQACSNSANQALLQSIGMNEKSLITNIEQTLIKLTDPSVFKKHNISLLEGVKNQQFNNEENNNSNSQEKLDVDDILDAKYVGMKKII